MSTVPQLRIRAGGPQDLAEVIALLNRSRLPTADLQSASHLQMWVLESEQAPAGVIALERFSTQGLVRSLTVAPEFRKRGCGKELVARLEQDARRDGVEQLVLLTETAERFFQSLGYAVIERAMVHGQIKASAEFRSLCPASAVCMHKALF
jgi:amino-acid N-acetyltransferase